MSWDAHARASDDGKRSRRLTAAELAEFEAAAERVTDETGSADGYLREGSLGLRASGRALGEATGRGVYPETTEATVSSPWDWSPDDVKAALASATWPEPADLYQASARAFLETCARLGLGVFFSW